MQIAGGGAGGAQPIERARWVCVCVGVCARVCGVKGRSSHDPAACPVEMQPNSVVRILIPEGFWRQRTRRSALCRRSRMG